MPQVGRFNGNETMPGVAFRQEGKVVPRGTVIKCRLIDGKQSSYRFSGIKG